MAHASSLAEIEVPPKKPSEEDIPAAALRVQGTNRFLSNFKSVVNKAPSKGLEDPEDEEIFACDYDGVNMTSEELEQMDVVPGEQLEPDKQDMQVEHILERIVSVLFHPISDMDILR